MPGSLACRNARGNRLAHLLGVGCAAEVGRAWAALDGFFNGADHGVVRRAACALALGQEVQHQRTFPSLFEPVHGSAPDIYGKNIANPIAMIWSGALMLDFLTQGQGAGRAAHDAMVSAIEETIKSGPRTPDLGGTANTTQVGEAIAARIAAG